MIRGFLFDMGGTLLENINLSFKNVFECIKENMPSEINLADYDDACKEVILDKLNAREENEIKLLDLMVDLFDYYQVQNMNIEQLEIECNRRLCELKIVPYVKEYLEKLKEEGYKLAVLSNTCFSLRAIIDSLDQFDLTRYFDTIIVSSEYGVRKPSSQLYKIALKEIGLKNNEVVMIGDTFEADVKGSSKLEIKSMYLNRKNDHLESDDKNLLRVFNSYDELINEKSIEEIFLKKYISKDALKCVDLLKEKGYEAYVVGGSVRNALMGLPINDYDITTSAYPQDVTDIFGKEDYHVVPTGEKHGTITVFKNHVPYEITTFRSDGIYLDNRHPEHVQFGVQLKEDLTRRDFTINAMCYDGTTFIDLFDGVLDLKKKQIKAVGTAKNRFEEDALRILRGLRFASYLGFNIEKETKKAIFETYPLLRNVAFERINDEILKMLHYSSLSIINEYKEIFEYVYQYKMESSFIDCINNNQLNETMRFAIFGPKLGSDWRKYRFSIDFTNEVMMYQNLNNDVDWDLYQYRLEQVKYGKERILKIIQYLSCIYKWSRDKILLVKEYYEMSKHLPDDINHLALNGRQIHRYGINEEKIRICKEELLDLIIKDELNNDVQALRNYLNENYKKFL